MTSFALRRPEEWFVLGQGVFDEVLAGYRRYGIRPHPDLRLVLADSPIPYYEPASRTVGFGAPDATQAKGRLYWFFLQHLLGAADLPELQETIEALLPWVTAHELAHHLRHAYGAPIENNYVEEQVTSLVACAFVREHPVYREGLPALRRALTRTARSTVKMAADSESYLSGYRLQAAEVLQAQGTLPPGALAEARALAEASGATVERVLASLGAVDEAQLAEARAARGRAEAYFNERYMANLGEYWRFGADWLLAELDRPDPESLGAVLETYVLTADWEKSRGEATQLLLEGSLRSADPLLAVAAAQALGDTDHARALPALLACLDDERGVVQAAALRALASRSGGPAAAASIAGRLLAGAPEVRGPAAHVLRLAGVEFATPDGAAALAEHALARLARGDASGWATLRALLQDDEDAVQAALEASGAAGPGPLLPLLLERLADGNPGTRARAARALATEASAALPLLRRLADEEPAVRDAARDALSCLRALDVLGAPPPDLPEPARLEALVLAVELGDERARVPLLEVGTRFQERAAALLKLEARLCAHAALEVMAVAAGEARRRQARLALRALGTAAGAAALDMAERALDSPDPDHRAGGRQLAVRAIGAEGPELARLLDEDAPAPAPGSLFRALVASLADEDPTLRLLATWAAPRLAPPPQAEALLARARLDGCLQVREEAGAWPARGGSMLTPAEKIMFLRANPAFAVVAVDTLRSLAELWVAQQFRAGERIFSEGDPGAALYVVTEGRVGIASGGDTLAELGPRQFFGEMALFDGQPRSATSTALQDTMVLRLDRDDFYRLGRRTPDLLVGIIGVLSERLRSANAALVEVPAARP